MIPIQEYVQRRQRLLDTIGDNDILLVSAAQEVTRSNDTEYTFRQDSHFFYLTGFNEPDAWLVLLKEQGEAESILFCRDKDPTAEIWHGRRLGADAAPEALAVDTSYPLSELADALVQLLDGKQVMHFAMGHLAHADELVLVAMNKLRSAPKQSKVAPVSITDTRSRLHEMRLFKSPAEVAVMQASADISVRAHQRAMLYSATHVDNAFEYQLAAEIHHEFAMAGAHSPAYNTIVGSGDNACILHYTENSDRLTKGDLVLIDAGAELYGYAADITRTFPVSGRFSEPQAKLYQLVLDAQLAALEAIKPGNTLVQATDISVKVITQGLIDLGILSGELAQNIQDKTYREFFMHGLGHWLGLDVHDVGDYKIKTADATVDRPLAAGMVLTVEPGIYIAPDAKVDACWRGIGIRIEDNVLITATGHEILTIKAPKTIADIEALMSPNKPSSTGNSENA